MSIAIPFPIKNPVAEPLQTWRILIKDLEVTCSLGIWEHEHTTPQVVRINVECDYIAPTPDDLGALNQVVAYDEVIEGIEKLCSAKHIRFTETLGQSIADFCLSDKRVQRVHVRVEKPTVYPNAQSVGIELVRERAGGRDEEKRNK